MLTTTKLGVKREQMARFVVTVESDEAISGSSLKEFKASGGGLSLREAIYLANNSSKDVEITFANKLAGKTIELSHS